MKTHRRAASKESDSRTLICIGVRSSSGTYDVLYGRGLSQRVSALVGRTKVMRGSAGAKYRRFRAFFTARMASLGTQNNVRTAGPRRAGHHSIR